MYVTQSVHTVSLILQFYSNLINKYKTSTFDFVAKDSITLNEFYRAPTNAFERVSVRAWLRALFTLVLARVLSYPNKWSHEEAMQNLLSLSAAEWDAEILPEEEVFNARGLLWPRSPWAVKGGLFSSRKGSGFLADIAQRYLVVGRRAQLNARHLRRCNAWP